MESCIKEIISRIAPSKQLPDTTSELCSAAKEIIFNHVLEVEKSKVCHEAEIRELKLKHSRLSAELKETESQLQLMMNDCKKLRIQDASVYCVDSQQNILKGEDLSSYSNSIDPPSSCEDLFAAEIPLPASVLTGLICSFFLP